MRIVAAGRPANQVKRRPQREKHRVAQGTPVQGIRAKALLRQLRQTARRSSMRDESK
jgi:hypothetical protein